METCDITYRALNSEFRKRLTFGVGLYAGFFSEINLMVLGIVYCLHNRIQFTLHSGNANFRLNEGWNDYFEPFCEEFRGELLDEVDFRWKIQYKIDLTKPRRLFRTLRYETKIAYLKKKLGVQYLTFDLLDEILNRKLEHIHYNIPQLGIQGDLQDACHTIAQLIWRPNRRTQKQVEAYKAQLNLPEKYLGFQIRRGDKHREIEFTNVELYIREASERSVIKNVFVLTDDYGVIEELREKFPEWTIYSLCRPEERGYTHADFFSKSRADIYTDTVRLIATIEILKDSELFVGAFSANPSMFLAMLMPREKTVSVDVPWQVWYGKEIEDNKG